MLGIPERSPPIMTPSTPRGGIRRKARGRPMMMVRTACFMSTFVSPRPVRKLPRLRLPTTAYRLPIT